jgi:hypothetical protein
MTIGILTKVNKNWQFGGHTQEATTELDDVFGPPRWVRAGHVPKKQQAMADAGQGSLRQPAGLKLKSVSEHKATLATEHTSRRLPVVVEIVANRPALEENPRTLP